MTTPNNALSDIDKAVVTGIRRTINRFRENPFYYFTESDIHASLVKDILDGYSDKLYPRIEGTSLRLSLVHLEYPTNFSFSRNEALHGEKADTPDNKKQRGNFDLAVLKEEKFSKIVKSEMEANKEANKEDTLISLLKSIISKDIVQNEGVHNKMNEPIGELIDYAVEVKFFHFNNASQEMFDQVKIDNYKLAKAIEKKAKIKPVNLIFCYYWNDSNNANSNWCLKMMDFRNNLLNGKIIAGHVHENEIPNEVLNIFIEVNVDQKANKKTIKPACCYKGGNSILPGWVGMITNGYEIQSKPST